MNTNNTWILILGLILGGLIVYFFMQNNAKVQTVTTIQKDTVYQYIQIPPIEIKGKTSYIKINVPDTANRKKADSLLRELDCLKSEMLAMQITETSILDTLINKDSIYIEYEYFTKQWYINLKLAERPIQTIKETVMIKENTDNKYWYGGVGLLVGIITGVLIK